MTHKTIINICLTLIALCWTMAIQAQYATVDGIKYYLYTDTKTAEVTRSDVTGDIVIPEKITVDGVEYPVTSIANYAFKSCSSLTSVAMPSVTSIGDGAFINCPFTHLSLPATLTSIGNQCFTETREITLAATTPAVLGTDAFWRAAVIRVPESAVDDYRTAAGWSDYKDQIFSMSDFAGHDVTVTAQEKESGLLNVLGQDNLGKVGSLKVTGTINSYDIMVIRNKMPYLHHLDLTDATIVANDYEYYTGCHTEDNVIGDYMFFQLYKLVSVKLPKNATRIGECALSSCGNLVEVVLPVKLESIGCAAFNGCSNLTNIDLPPTLKTIGSSAFPACI